MLPKFLRPEILPYASVEVIPATRADFHAFITNPSTGPTLDAMLADNAAVDAAIAEQERDPDDRDEDRGSACGSNCGYCGGCS